MKELFLQDIPLSLIRHNDLPCYNKEGFGGCKIEMWPMYNFFRQYLDNKKESARQNFENWYREQLTKYHASPKSEGGMRHGSLYQLIEKRCNAPFSKVEEGCKDEVIRERVGQRFKMLEDIQNQGYKVNETERIDAVRKNELIYLKGGHHRAAALSALGKTELPGVLVFPNQLVYNMIRFWRWIKYDNI
ncbi:MAG: hypothetical protein AAB513_00175 [Patescibacteria group bacterium]